MKLTMYPVGLNGNMIAKDQFGYVLKPAQGFNPESIDSIKFWCRGNRERICSVDLTLGPPVDADEKGKRRWNWNGNMECPTLTPSIACDARCGWHGHIVEGEINP